MNKINKNNNIEKRSIEIYSRQQLVIGLKGQHRLMNSSLGIIGFDGLGAEISKNSLLAGVHQLILCDDDVAISSLDRSTNVRNLFCRFVNFY